MLGWFRGAADTGASAGTSEAHALAAHCVRTALRASRTHSAPASEIFENVALQLVACKMAPANDATAATALLFANAERETAARAPAPAPAHVPTQDHVGVVAAHMDDVVYDAASQHYILVPDSADVERRMLGEQRAFASRRALTVIATLVERAAAHVRAHGATRPFCVVALEPGECYVAPTTAPTPTPAPAAEAPAEPRLRGAARTIADYCQRLRWSLEIVTLRDASAGGAPQYAIYAVIPARG